MVMYYSSNLDFNKMVHAKALSASYGRVGGYEYDVETWYCLDDI